MRLELVETYSGQCERYCVARGTESKAQCDQDGYHDNTLFVHVIALETHAMYGHVSSWLFAKPDHKDTVVDVKNHGPHIGHWR